ncbi:DNA/RNA non-specific endonuclease [Bacillus sp. S14(2024)]|uniref:DNA/RNA non-specific endonuclease n=1 Tax=Bacillus sp. S14(2024) TaxID=3162884 RepID=UPI003D1D07D3
MSLNMYLGEVRAQSQSMNAMCVATIQGMEQAINSIDAFVFDSVLQGQTYDSAKTFFAQTFRTLAQGIIYLCEELIRQNDAFPNDFQSQVASTDVIEQEIRDQIRELEQAIAALEAMSEDMPGAQAILQIYYTMLRKLQEKLEHLYAFNYTSSSNYDTALQLAASVAQGLAEVQGGKGFSAASGTFSIQELNMGWTASIQKITEDKAREAQIKKVMALQEQEANRPWYEKTAISTWESIKEFFKGAGSAALENVIGLEPRDNDELESKLTYQAGRLFGNVVAGAASIVEILEGLTIIGGANFLTLVAEAGTGGLASPIAIPLDAAATTAGFGLISHGIYVGGKTFQNSVDTLQKIQSSSSSGGRVNKVKETDRLDKEGNVTKGTGNTPKITEIKEGDLGKHIIKGKNGRKELAPNVRYITEDGYKYTTDELGRIVDVEAEELILQKGKRNTGMQVAAGREDRLPDDDGGHLIGTQFHGSGDIDNLVAQNKQINRSGGEWYSMEKEWANALSEIPPKKVYVKIEPVYQGTSLRPNYFEIVYEIEGKGIFEKTIRNRAGG